MFIKSVEFPNPLNVIERKRIVNDPSDHADFDKLMTHLFQSSFDVSPKIITVMGPVGPTFHFAQTSNTVAEKDTGSPNLVEENDPPTPPGKATIKMTKTIPSDARKNTITTNNDVLTGVTLATSLSDGQFHIGNADASGDFARLYHVYPQQVVLCAPLQNIKTELSVELGWGIDPVTKGDVVPKSYAQALALQRFSAMSAGPSSSGSTTTGVSAAASGGVFQSAAAQISQSLTINRISALVETGQCATDELVVPISSEADFAATTQNFIRVEWRSPADVIEYLGGLLRNDGKIDDALKFTANDKIGDHIKHYLAVDYDGDTFYFSGDSLRAIRIISELVNASKLPSTTTITQPSLLIP